MNSLASIYVAGDSVVHRLDAGAKILLLLVFSVGIFFVRTWWGMGACALLVGACVAIARIPLRSMAPLAPVAFLAAFAVLFAVVNDPSWEGLLRGLFVFVRMIVLVAASMVVCLTSTSSELLSGFSRLIGPLRVLKVPVDDIALTLSLALRFIPVIADEFSTVRKAQRSRGGDAGGLGVRRTLQVWGAAFSAVFIGLFRHAQTLASAMDARCYDVGQEGRK